MPMSWLLHLSRLLSKLSPAPASRMTIEHAAIWGTSPIEVKALLRHVQMST